MKTYKTLLTAGIASLVFVTTPVLADDFLDADAIKALISGKTITAEHKRGFTFKVYFDADGETAIRQQDGDETETTYKFKGNRHCIFWKGRDRCANIRDNGDGTYARVNRSGKVPVTWVEITDGKDL